MLVKTLPVAPKLNQKSEISEKMYKAGYENIHNIDISSVVIELMSKRCADLKNMTCTCINTAFSTHRQP